jgi:hypothetical protein
VQARGVDEIQVADQVGCIDLDPLVQTKAAPAARLSGDPGQLQRLAVSSNRDATVGIVKG